MKHLDLLTQLSKTLAVAALMTTLLATQSAHSGEQWVLNLDKGSGKVDFHAIGKPKMLKIHGQGGRPSGAFLVDGDRVKGKATFDLTTLDTGMSLRNSHMKEKYLETDKHPKAVFELLEIKLPVQSMNSDFSSEAPFKGRLTVRGVTQDVSGTAKLQKSSGTLKGEVEFSTTVKGFKIDVPSFAGVTMADEVQVRVEFAGPFSPRSASQKQASMNTRKGK